VFQEKKRKNKNSKSRGKREVDTLHLLRVAKKREREERNVTSTAFPAIVIVEKLNPRLRGEKREV